MVVTEALPARLWSDLPGQLGMLPELEPAPEPEQMDLFDETGAAAVCVACGVRPWGHGYCGELCRECAAEGS